MDNLKGRPTEYKDEFIDKVDEYLATCTEEEDIFHKTVGEKSDSYERMWRVKLPKIEEFALFIGVHKDSLYEWAKTNKRFSDALDKIRTKQHNMLIDGATSGRYNPVISKLILSSNHGYKEKSDVTTDGKPISITYDKSFEE